MTTTPTAPAPVVVPTATAPGGPVIDQSIRDRISLIIDEQNDLIKERHEVIRGSWIAAVAQEHLLMLGPGGTGKSFLVRNLVDHIQGGTYFEVAVDETTDPSQVFGPPDIKAMVEDGKTRRVPTGMLPEATHAFIDEFFNANGPLLHSMMPALNERAFHNNGQPSVIPLRSAFMGTNQLNADADQAALWDRIHLRYVVNYISDRKSQAEMVGDAIARMSQLGRGVSTNLVGAQKTLVTLDELDQAHKEALNLDVPDPVLDLFFDIRDELQHGSAKIQISDRRAVEGMAAVMANAWLNNHTTVTVGDLDILANMWWAVQDQMAVARSVILAATNPGEKAALDLLDGLDDLKKEVKQANDSDLDASRKKRVGVESVKNADKLLNEAKTHLAKAQAAGTSVTRLEEVIKKTEAFKVEVGMSIFNLDPTQMQNLAAAGRPGSGCCSTSAWARSMPPTPGSVSD
jgi:MoxR-like ATPase